MNSPKGRRKEFDSVQDLLEIAKKPSNLPKGGCVFFVNIGDL